MEKFYNPHDRFFKEVLGNVANTQAFLETYLPPEVLQTIDVGTIQAEKDSFIEQDLKDGKGQLHRTRPEGILRGFIVSSEHTKPRSLRLHST